MPWGVGALMGRGAWAVQWVPQEEAILGAGGWLCSVGGSLTFFGPQSLLCIMDGGLDQATGS